MAAYGTAGRERIVRFESAAWGPAEVSHLDLDVLSDFTGLSHEQCVARLSAYRPQELAGAWLARNPTTPEEIREFYVETDCYLWELLGWNGSAAYRPYLQRLEQLATIWPPSEWPTALDYGSGVGTAAIRLAEIGYGVTLADVPGRTLALARRRLSARGIEFGELAIDDDQSTLPRERWDVVVCFDVIEHLVDPASTARELVRGVKKGGGLAIVASFNAPGEDFPQHLAAGRERFGGIRWEVFLGGLGLQNLGSQVYRKIGGAGRLARRLNYQLARAVGFRIQRVR
jgi:SAM-dependent methyltransferase